MPCHGRCSIRISPLTRSRKTFSEQKARYMSVFFSFYVNLKYLSGCPHVFPFAKHNGFKLCRSRDDIGILDPSTPRENLRRLLCSRWFLNFASRSVGFRVVLSNMSVNLQRSHNRRMDISANIRSFVPRSIKSIG